MEGSDVPTHPRHSCYFCGSEGPIQAVNLVAVTVGNTTTGRVDCCPTCRERFERLFDASSQTDRPSSKERARAKTLKQIIDEVAAGRDDGAPYEEILARAEARGLSQEVATDELHRLKHRGEIYEPIKEVFRTT